MHMHVRSWRGCIHHWLCWHRQKAYSHWCRKVTKQLVTHQKLTVKELTSCQSLSMQFISIAVPSSHQNFVCKKGPLRLNVSCFSHFHCGYVLNFVDTKCVYWVRLKGCWSSFVFCVKEPNELLATFVEHGYVTFVGYYQQNFWLCQLLFINSIFAIFQNVPA